MKRAIKSFLVKTFPTQFNTIQAIRTRRYFFRLSKEQGLDVLAERAANRLGRKTIRGPFAGMTLPDGELWAAACQYITGSVEKELHPALETILKKRYRTAVNVGCAEGYYTVGFACRLPTAKVIAYDLDPVARRYCRRYAAANGFSDRVTVRGACTHDRLQQDLSEGSALVLCDTEGFEMVLLDPHQCPALCKADIIVEIHEEPDRKAGDELLSRFSKSHDATIVWSSDRTGADYPELDFFTAEERDRAVAEPRGMSQRWAILHARSTNEPG